MKLSIKLVFATLLAFPSVMALSWSAQAEGELRQPTVVVKGKRIHRTYYYRTVPNIQITPDYASIDQFSQDLAGGPIAAPEPTEDQECSRVREELSEVSGWLDAVNGDASRVVIVGNEINSQVQIFGSDGSVTIINRNQPVGTTTSGTTDTGVGLLAFDFRLLEGSITYDYANSQVTIDGRIQIRLGSQGDFTETDYRQTVAIDANSLALQEAFLENDLRALGCNQ